MIKPMLKPYLIMLILIIISIFGIRHYLKSNFFELRKAENTVVMLEKIKTVTKLISVEGQFSELYDYKESYDYDFFNLFSKKILVRVTAKVSAGYDFEKININIDSLNKTVTLNEFPSPEILSVDHNLDYYDITQGTFNKFTTEEYNMINKKAKDMIATKAAEGPMLATAENQKTEFIKMIEMALQSAGWTLIINKKLPVLN